MNFQCRVRVLRGLIDNCDLNTIEEVQDQIKIYVVNNGHGMARPVRMVSVSVARRSPGATAR